MKLFYWQLMYPKMIAFCETIMFRLDKMISNCRLYCSVLSGGKKLIEIRKKCLVRNCYSNLPSNVDSSHFYN